MISIVPTPQDGYPDTRVRVALGGAQYGIRWLWNGREGVWSFSIDDADGVPILAGVRVVLDADLLAWTSDPRAPAGLLAVTDSSGSTVEPGLNDLGARVQVLYVTPDELTDV